MLSGMLPGALAHSEVNPETDAVEIAFFKLGPDAPAKPSADNAITDYQIEYSADTLKKGTTGAGHDNGAFYLETNTGALDDFVTISGMPLSSVHWTKSRWQIRLIWDLQHLLMVLM